MPPGNQNGYPHSTFAPPELSSNLHMRNPGDNFFEPNFSKIKVEEGYGLNNAQNLACNLGTTVFG